VALDEMSQVRPAPLVLVIGMMNTRAPTDFIAAFAGKTQKVLTLSIPGEQNAHSAATIAEAARDAGFDAEPKRSVEAALRAAAEIKHARVVICGSLYLAGHVLYRNGTPPD
jgi:dihydrofolate synthase/folylpolyglutamate synthase